MRTKWNQDKATLNILERHASKCGYPLKWKTRVSGTTSQVGKKFPVGNGSKLPLPPRIQLKFSRMRSPLLRDAAEEIVQRDLNGDTLVLRFKNGQSLVTPLEGSKIETIDPASISEVAILSGGKTDLKTTLHKFGQSAGSWLKNQAEKMAELAPTLEDFSPEKIAEKMGQMSAYPAKVKTAYEYGRRKELEPKSLVLTPDREKELKEEIRKKYFQFESGATVKKADSECLSLSERIDKRIREKKSTRPWGSQSQAKNQADIAALEDLRSRAAVIEKMLNEPFTSESMKYRLNVQKEAMLQQVRKLGGKHKGGKWSDSYNPSSSQYYQTSPGQPIIINTGASQEKKDSGLVSGIMSALPAILPLLGAKEQKQRKHKVHFKTSKGKNVTFMAGGKSLSENVEDSIQLGRRLIGEKTRRS